MNVPKTARGKRPKFFEDRSVDYVMAMSMALIEEVAVLRDRLDLVERVAEKKGLLLSDELEKFEFDETALTERETRRRDYMDRLFAVFHQEAAELGEIDSSEKYQALLDEIAAT